MKKHRKTIVSIFFSLLFLFSITPASLAANQSIEEARFMKLMSSQEHALKANQILRKNIMNDDLEYPDYYGGVYIKDNILHIQLADDSIELTDKISQLLSGYSNWITIDYVDYSYNYLYALAESAAQALCCETDLYEVTGFYVNIVENSSVVTVVDENVAMKAGRIYSEAKSNTAPVRIEISKNAYNEEESCTKSIQTRSTITLKGGTQIYNSTARFTLGFCGKYGSLDAFVTCGHGQDASAWTRVGGSGGDVIGGVSYLRYSNNGNGDFSIHTIAAGLPNDVVLTNKIQAVSDSGDDISVTGIYDDPPVGTYLFKYNATPVSTGATRYRSYCEVEAVGVTIYSGNTLYVKNMTRAGFVSTAGTFAGGDSGGPIFLRNGNDWKISGVYHGHGQFNDEAVIFFTPWKYIVAAGFDAQIN